MAGDDSAALTAPVTASDSRRAICAMIIPISWVCCNARWVVFIYQETCMAGFVLISGISQMFSELDNPFALGISNNK